jgi:hypothetical protein
VISAKAAVEAKSKPVKQSGRASCEKVMGYPRGFKIFFAVCKGATGGRGCAYSIGKGLASAARS